MKIPRVSGCGGGWFGPVMLWKRVSEVIDR